MNTIQKPVRNLYLIPSTLGETDINLVLPTRVVEILHSLDHFVVENERSARRFLIRSGYNKPLSMVKFYILDEHTEADHIPFIFSAAGMADIGMLSEAGAPAVADPGAELVREAQRRDLRIIPLTGPSSLLLALMASGLNGQNFAFNGYLPVKDFERVKRIKYLEKKSRLEKQSQIFIETPYRNNQLIRSLASTCHPDTLLCIAVNLTTSEEWIKTRRILEWKAELPELNRKPSVFIMQA